MSGRNLACTGDAMVHGTRAVVYTTNMLSTRPGYHIAWYFTPRAENWCPYESPHTEVDSSVVAETPSVGDG